MSVVIPNLEKAVIERSKLSDYLLSEVHPVGRYKAVFFRALGFESEHWLLLREILLRATLENLAELGQPSPFGQKYLVKANILGLNGRQARVNIVWIVEPEGLVPRLVSVYPG